MSQGLHKDFQIGNPKILLFEEFGIWNHDVDFKSHVQTSTRICEAIKSTTEGRIQIQTERVFLKYFVNHRSCFEYQITT